jgi:hypothetical protein
MSKETAEAAYLTARNRAMKALKDIETMINEMTEPAPEWGNRIDWGDACYMQDVATNLEAILPEE